MAKTGDSIATRGTTLYVNLKDLRARVEAAAAAEGRSLTNMTTRLLVLGLAAYEQQQNPTHDESRRTSLPAGSH